jgi:hypothetical protein
VGESTKSLLALVMIVAGLFAAGSWFMAEEPDATTWQIRLVSTAIALLALILILLLQFRRDRARDFLREVAGNYFNRDGFCFAISATEEEGIAWFQVYFQNQQDRPSIGRVALRPARGFFLTRAKFDLITYEIHCPPVGFGVAYLAVPVPAHLQGKRQAFEVGASVRYPEGRGRRLRFQDGIFLRANSNFGDSFATALAVAGAATGSIVLTSPATVTINLPKNVAEELPTQLAPEIRILWQLGDAELQAENL